MLEITFDGVVFLAKAEVGLVELSKDTD